MNGNQDESSAYYPFGGTRSDNSSVYLNYKYTGQEQDQETGLYNYGARLYDPDLGRFLAPDSIVPDPANPQSLNRYSYVLNNPLNYTDPSGHGFFDWLFGSGDDDDSTGSSSNTGSSGSTDSASLPVVTGTGNSNAEATDNLYLGNYSYSNSFTNGMPDNNLIGGPSSGGFSNSGSLLGTIGGWSAGGGQLSYSGLSTLASAFSWANYGASGISNYPALPQNSWAPGGGNPFGTLSRGDIVSAFTSGVDIYRTFAKASSLVTSKDIRLATLGVLADTIGGTISMTPIQVAGIKNWVGGTVSVAGMTVSALSLNPAGVARGGIGLLSSVPVFYSDKSQSVLDWWIDRVSPF
jgi:RHS repeat-associated protein